ncbi:alpha-crystallin B chain isoform X2 [Microplitis mediator]|uniref:alpha-crystallin B chain isoform X1 n=1 Tax=Microplitis demolitor TaxID=69319 RepID=UPI0006D4CBE5|nr:alpha-crystallin B chain isoform X1 [Microplitis demolitor]XP_057341001.1 alpha-crystallin B chain isoform X2 [Microplitis mediator]
MADSGTKRNIPIKLGDFSVIDSEFSNIRERFDAEMRKMEDEMSRFRSELMNRESNNFFKTTSSTTSQQSTQHNSSLSPQHDSRTWLDGLNSPLIQDEGDNKMLKLRFDVSQYTPEEIVVKTVDNKLLVHAKHEEKTESKSVYREYNREFLLPKGTNPETIKSSLSKDGVLTVEAPLPALGAGEKLIPIAHS